MMNVSDNAKALFMSAIEKYSPDQWPAFLDGACGDNVGLRGRVEELLQAHIDMGSIHASGFAPTLDQPPLEKPGTQIGPYKLLQQIGEGGMGVVYMAEQHKPLHRRVALKIIKPGMDTSAVIARFEAERQALALMDHPNIAKVFDAGTTDSGRPFFVMELIQGIAITDYCDRNAVPIPERLDLFLATCRGVQHAHHKGVIHRDIKPGNVLVTLHDGVPVVKIIDFGIAKALSQRLTDKTLFTSFMQMVGTPLYMSPEQAEMSGLGVDTRSDIYSLGVLLYELLTGTTPLDQARLRSAAFEEIRRIICEDDPPKPSTRLSSLGGTLTAISSKRNSQPERLTRQVRGELDWIVMKTLEKDRQRRYQTPRDLALDIERYLRGEIVEARPPSTAYRLRKLWRRHRLGISTAAMVLAAITCGLVVALISYARLRHTESRLRSVAEEHRRSQLDNALMFAYDGKLAQTRRIAASLEELLPQLDTDYKQGTVRLMLEGIAQFHDGQIEESRRTLNRALELDPDNVLTRSVFARSLLNTGDWPAFLEEVSKLKLRENADFHERLFYWHAQLEVHESAADGLKQIVAEYPQSALARATYALALVDPAGTTPRPDLAIVEAARAADDGPLSSLVALALIRTHIVAAQEADGPRRTQLLEEALKHAPLLERLPNYASGRLALAELYDLAGQRAQAESHFEACGFPDIIAAVFARDRDDRRLQIARGKWGDSPIARLNSLLIDIGKKPNADVLRGYRALVDDARASTAVRTAALQVPFRLREFEMAIDDARNVRERLQTPAELHLLKMSDIGFPLELGADAGSASSRFARARSTGSKADKLLADFWEGHFLLGIGDAAGAKAKFLDCTNNWIGFVYNYWARCLLDRLEENPNWPNPPPAPQ